MARISIWDYPVRLFHWALTACFFSALALAQFAPEHSQGFDVHMLLGLVLIPLVLLRILWGFVGTKHARFSSFQLSPKAVFDYLAGILTMKGKRDVGHNPATSWATFVMLGLILAIVVSGLLMGNGEVFEEGHGLLAYVCLAIVGVHVVGVFIHIFRHKENIILSMFTGSKEGVEDEAIGSSRPFAAIAFLLLMGVCTTAIVRGYDRQARHVDIPVLGQSIQLGEGEGDRHDRNRRHHDDD